MRSMEIVVVKVVGKEGGAVVGGVVGAGIGPLAGDGLDEALGLAIGLRAVGAGEGVFEPEVATGGGKELGAISGAAIGEEAPDVDAVIPIEGDGLVEGLEDAGGLFIGMKGGEGQAAVIVDGDVEALHAGPGVAVGAVAGGADAGFLEAAELLDIEVEEVAGGGVFVADDGGFGRLEGREPVEPVAAQDAGERGEGDGQDHPDLGIGTAFAAQGEDPGFELGSGPAGLAQRSRRVIVQAAREAGRLGASEPAADGLFADAESGGGVAQGAAELSVEQRHLGSRQWGESGISVHVVRVEGRSVVCSSTTSLAHPFRADNLLKHYT